MNALKKEVCVLCRVPMLVVLGVVITYAAAHALTVYRISKAETAIEDVSSDVIDLKVAIGEIRYIKASVTRIEETVDRAARKGP